MFEKAGALSPPCFDSVPYYSLKVGFDEDKVKAQRNHMRTHIAHPICLWARYVTIRHY